MKKNTAKRIAALAVCFLLTASLICAGAGVALAQTSRVEAGINSILGYKMSDAGVQSVQQLINGELAAGAGLGSEWYVLALRQYEKGYDFSAYTAALKKYVAANEVSNASTRLRYAVSFAAVGENYEYISSALDNSIGKLGIMSWIFGLHIMNNGYACSAYSQSGAVDRLLSLQLADGGFALSGETADVDVTAMAVQALARHYSSQAVRTAVDKALALLSQRQLADGGFMSYGVANPESSAQVITALASLGIDGLSDERFIKNGNNLLDGLMQYQLADGSFCHTMGGQTNYNATVQALYSLVALWRGESGLSPLYIFAQKATPAPVVTTMRQVVQVVPGTAKPPSTTTAVTTTTRASRRRQTTAAAEKNETTRAAVSEVKKTTLPPAPLATTAQPAGETHSSFQGSEATAVLAGTHAALAAMQPEQSTAGAAASEEAQTIATPTDFSRAPNEKISYKAIVYAAIAIAALAGCAALLLTGRKSVKNFIAVILAALVLCAINAFTDIQSRDGFYTGESETLSVQDGVTVTLSISCINIIGLSQAEYIPADGIILAESEFTVEENSTVYDVLVLAARQKGIQMENSSAAESSAYISGINYIYEFDFGDLSGWRYMVNGVFPSVGCGGYTVSRGDKIEWVYSLDLGDDIK